MFTPRADHPTPADGPAHVRDPELRATLERMGRIIAAQDAAAPPVQAPVPPPRLPVFPDAARPVVNDVARSALFACVQGKDRQRLDDALLATVEGVEIRFTGQQLNQDDHDLLMQVVHMAAHVPLGAYALLSGHTLLQELHRGTGGQQYRQLRDDLKRLVAGTVSLRHPARGVEYMGHLIDDAVHDEESHHWLIRLNPTLRPLYGPSMYTLVDWAQRIQLRGKDLARWLQLYLSTHAAPFPVNVATLKDLSGSRTTALRTFRQRLRQALADLQVNGDLVAWEIDDADLVHVDRGAAITTSQRRHLARHAKRR
jgi:TrfA protein